MFVRLGFEWEIYNEGNYIWINNNLQNKLFSITDNNKRNMILKINEGIKEEELLKEFNNDWIEFKNELRLNNVIYFSKYKSSYRESFERGGKVVETSNYIRHKNNISRVFLEINNKQCRYNCDHCNEKSEFPCLTCYSSKENYVIDKSIIDKFFYDSQRIYIEEIFFTGTNPLDNYDYIKYVIEKIKEREQKPKIYAVCNNVMSEEVIEFVKSNNISLVINIVSNDLKYLKKINTFIEILRNKNINVITQNRVINNGYDCNAAIKEYVRDNQPIIKINNIVRASNIEINSISDIRNICKYGKCFIDTEGYVSVCKESHEIRGNILNESLANILSLLETEWNDSEEIFICKECSLKKICIRCPEAIKEFKDNSQYCFLHK